MSSRVAAAALALVAALLLVSSAIGMPWGWWQGHPQVNGTEQHTKDVTVTLLEATGCKTGGNGECTDLPLPEVFSITGFVELGTSGLLALVLLVMTIAALANADAKKTFGKIVIGVTILCGLVAAALIVQGPKMGSGHNEVIIPIGYGMYAFFGALATSILASVFAMQPPPKMQLRPSRAAFAPDLAPPPRVHEHPVQQPVDVLSLIQQDDHAPRPEPGRGTGPQQAINPHPSTNPGALFQSAPQLRPLYDADPHQGGTGGYVAPTTPIPSTPLPGPRGPIAPITTPPPPAPMTAPQKPEPPRSVTTQGVAAAPPPHSPPAFAPSRASQPHAPSPDFAPPRQAQPYAPSPDSPPPRQAQPYAPSPDFPPPRQAQPYAPPPDFPPPRQAQPYAPSPDFPPPGPPQPYAPSPDFAPPGPPQPYAPSPPAYPPSSPASSPDFAPSPAYSSPPQPPAFAPSPASAPPPSGYAPPPAFAPAAASEPAPGFAPAGAHAASPAFAPAPGAPAPAAAPASPAMAATAREPAPRAKAPSAPPPPTRLKAASIPPPPSASRASRPSVPPPARTKPISVAPSSIVPPGLGAKLAAAAKPVVQLPPLRPMMLPTRPDTDPSESLETVDRDAAMTIARDPANMMVGRPATDHAVGDSTDASISLPADEVETVAREKVDPAELLASVERDSASEIATIAHEKLSARDLAIGDSTSPSTERARTDVPRAVTNIPVSTAPESLPPPKDDKASTASGPAPACPQCEAPMAWVEEHLRFYCKSCRMYF